MVWFACHAPCPHSLSGRRTCVNICAKCGCSLTDTKHSPSFCVCVFGGWKEAMSRGGHGQFMGLVLVRFQCTNCCCCCCPYGLVFGNLCSVCIVCAPVHPPLPLPVSPCCERQAFSCLNLSCIMWPIKQSKRNQNIEHREGRAACALPRCRSLSISFLFFFFKFPIAYFNYFRLLRVLHGCFCLISVFI